MAFTVIPNLTPPSFTRFNQSSSHKSSSSLSQSHSYSAIHHNNNNNNHGAAVIALQSTVESPPLRVSISPPPDPRQDFYINLGLAVRTLRHDYPLLFTTDLNYDIYRYFSLLLRPKIIVHLTILTGVEIIANKYVYLQ